MMPATSETTKEASLTNYQRLARYIHERFPILQNGLPIAAFSTGVLSYVSRLLDAPAQPDISAYTVAFICSFFFFLQLRIFDEFKDFHEDSRYRPYRPVPRGLISLRELGWLWVASAVIQLGVTLLLTPKPVVFILAIWTYAGLLKVEFFIPSWLNKLPLSNIAIHIFVIPLITLYVASCSLVMPDIDALIWLLLMSYFSFFIVEIGRKIRPEKDEEYGVDTYSKLWGINHALMVWLSVMLITSALAVAAASLVDTVLPTIIGCGLLLLMSVVMSLRFMHEPTVLLSKAFPLLSGFWIIALYLLVGTGLGF